MGEAGQDALNHLANLRLPFAGLELNSPLLRAKNIQNCSFCDKSTKLAKITKSRYVRQ